METNQAKHPRKVIALLKKCSKRQMAHLKKYLESDFFQTSESCVQLFDYLYNLHPRFEKYRNQEIMRHLSNYDEIKDPQKNLSYVFNNLYKKVLDFIAFDEFQKQKKLQQKLRIDFFYKNHLDQPLEDEMINYCQVLQKKSFRDTDYYFEQMTLGDKIYFFPDHNKFKRDLNKGEPLFRKLRERVKDFPFELTQSSKNIDTSFLLTRLKFILEVLQRKKIIKDSSSKQSPNLEEKTILTLAKKYAEENPIVQVYIYLIQSVLDKKTTSNIHQISDLFIKSSHFLQPFERRTLFQFIANEMGFLSRKGNQNIGLQTKLDFYQNGEKANCFVVNDRIHDIFFTNLILLFSKNKNFNFANHIISKYGKYLHPELKKEVIRFSKVCILFYEEKYSEVIQTLSKKSKFTQLSLQHRARVFLLCSKYEVCLSTPHLYGNFDDFEKSIENIKKYYKRKDELTEEKRLHYLNFIKTLKQIISLSPKNGIVEKQRKLTQLVNSFSTVAAKSWLIEKIDDL